MSSTTTGRVVGALFLLAFLAYGAGMALVSATTGTPPLPSEVVDHPIRLTAGALLMLANSVVVICIGILMLPILRHQHPFTATAYLVARVFEGIVLAVGVLFLLLLAPIAVEHQGAGAAEAAGLTALARVAQDANTNAYQIAMAVFGLGAVLFCRALLRSSLVPRALAVWGVVGYAVLSAGAALELLGYGVGLALSVPGGLFEIALGLLLLARGLPATSERPETGVDRLAVPAPVG